MCRSINSEETAVILRQGNMLLEGLNMLFSPSHAMNTINKTRWRDHSNLHKSNFHIIFVGMAFQTAFFPQALMMNFQGRFLNLYFLASLRLDFPCSLNKSMKLNAVPNDLSYKSLKSYLNGQIMNTHLSDTVIFPFKILLLLKNCTVQKKRYITHYLGMLFLKDKTFSFDHFKHWIREVPFWSLKW